MIRTIAVAGILAVTLAASAKAEVPQIPTPVNPRPANPIATDGTPLPLRTFAGPGYNTLATGRSVGFDALVPGPIGGLVNGGVGLAGTAINGIGTATGSIVGGTLGVR